MPGEWILFLSWSPVFSGLNVQPCSTFLQLLRLGSARLLCSWNLPGKNTGVDAISSTRGLSLSSWPRDRSHVSCISSTGRQILYHCTTCLSSVHSLSPVQQFAVPQTAACQCSLTITNTQSLLKLMSFELVRPSNHLILCYHFLLLPSIFPSIRDFSDDQPFLPGDQSIGVSASTSVLPMSIQDWFPLGWTGLIPLQSKGLWRVFSKTILQKHQLFNVHLYI